MSLHERRVDSGLAQAEGIIREIQEKVHFNTKVSSQDAFLMYAFLQATESQNYQEYHGSTVTAKFGKAADTKISPEQSVSVKLNYQEVGTVGNLLVANHPDADPKQRKFQQLKAGLYGRLADSFVVAGGQDNPVLREKLQLFGVSREEFGT